MLQWLPAIGAGASFIGSMFGGGSNGPSQDVQDHMARYLYGISDEVMPSIHEFYNRVGEPNYNAPGALQQWLGMMGDRVSSGDYYFGNSVAPMSQDQQYAQQLVRDMLQSPMWGTAQNTLQDIITGQPNQMTTQANVMTPELIHRIMGASDYASQLGGALGGYLDEIKGLPNQADKVATGIGEQWGTQIPGQIQSGLAGGYGDLAKTASGGMLSPNTNPYLSQYFDEGARKLTDTYNQATNQVGTTANKAGQYGGSGWALLQAENAKNLGQSLGDLSTNLYGGAYNTERDRQQQAMNSLFGQQMGLTGQEMDLWKNLYNTEEARRMGLAGMGQDIYQQAYGIGQQQQIPLLNLLTGAQDTNAANQIRALAVGLPWMQQATSNIGALMTSGEAQQAYQQQVLNDQMRQYYEQMYTPGNIMSQYFSYLQGSPMMSTYQPQQGSGYQQPSFGNRLLGSAANAAGMYSSLNGMFGGTPTGAMTSGGYGGGMFDPYSSTNMFNGGLGF